MTSISAMAQEVSGGGGDTFLSRITVAAPFFSAHFPSDRDFNDDNWGGAIFYALDTHTSLVGGDIINSYRRNTGFAAISLTPWTLDLKEIRISPGALVGIDLTNGYKRYNPVEPLLGAVTIKISSPDYRDLQFQFLNRLGLLVTVIPGFGDNRATATNLAIALRL